jgi:hypothetical protein
MQDPWLSMPQIQPDLVNADTAHLLYHAYTDPHLSVSPDIPHMMTSRTQAILLHGRQSNHTLHHFTVYI